MIVKVSLAASPKVAFPEKLLFASRSATLALNLASATVPELKLDAFKLVIVFEEASIVLFVKVWLAAFKVTLLLNLASAKVPELKLEAFKLDTVFKEASIVLLVKV